MGVGGIGLILPLKAEPILMLTLCGIAATVAVSRRKILKPVWMQGSFRRAREGRASILLLMVVAATTATTATIGRGEGRGTAQCIRT